MNKLFFKNERPNEKVKKFKRSLDEFRNLMISVSKSTNRKEHIKKLFSTDPIKKKWIQSQFLDQPLIASIINLSKIQADIHNKESKTISVILSGKLEEGIAINKFETLVYRPKMLMRDENIETKIVLASDNSSLEAY
ncbi:MAG: hypothetical protein ACMUEM_00055 [Flavobacteriales bacterium AspAUS03]